MNETHQEICGTRFLVRMTSWLADLPRAFAADRKPLKSGCKLANCFSSFFSSRLIAAKMLVESSGSNLPQRSDSHQSCIFSMSYSTCQKEVPDISNNFLR